MRYKNKYANTNSLTEKSIYLQYSSVTSSQINIIKTSYAACDYIRLLYTTPHIHIHMYVRYVLFVCICALYKNTSVRSKITSDSFISLRRVYLYYALIDDEATDRRVY